MNNISMTAFRLEHEKLASKKQLTKKMKEQLARLLYGKKPKAGKTFRNIGTGVGAAAGGATYGPGVGGAAAILALSRPKLHGLEKHLNKIVAGGTLVGIGGGGAMGRMGGKQIDKLLNRKALAKYKKRKKITNQALAGGGAFTLGALLGSKKKSKKGKSKKASAWLRPPNPSNLVKAPKSSPLLRPAALLGVGGRGPQMWSPGKIPMRPASVLDRYRGIRNKPNMAPTTTPSTPKPMSPAQKQ